LSSPIINKDKKFKQLRAFRLDKEKAGLTYAETVKKGPKTICFLAYPRETNPNQPTDRKVAILASEFRRLNSEEKAARKCCGKFKGSPAIRTRPP